ncbi:MAG: M3 family oligoendopeptidase, partial [Stellaceae bacterium]
MRVLAAAEAVAGARKSALGVLPQWDLSDLYPGPDSPALTADLARLAEDAEAFHRRHQGRLAELSGAALG